MVRINLGSSTLCVWPGGTADHDTAMFSCYNLNFGSSPARLCTVEQYRVAACYTGQVAPAAAVWHADPLGGQGGMFAVSTGCTAQSVQPRFFYESASVYCCVEWMNY
jgi:hypothetical protein